MSHSQAYRIQIQTDAEHAAQGGQNICRHALNAKLSADQAEQTVPEGQYDKAIREQSAADRSFWQLVQSATGLTRSDFERALS